MQCRKKKRQEFTVQSLTTCHFRTGTNQALCYKDCEPTRSPKDFGERCIMNLKDFLWRHESHLQRKAGETLFQEGQPGDFMYVLLEGQIDVLIHGHTVGTFEAVEIIGEMALIDAQPRSATVVTKTDCNLVRIDQSRFKYLIQQRPEFAIDVMRMLVERIRWMDALAQEHRLSGAADTLKTREQLKHVKTLLQALSQQIQEIIPRLENSDEGTSSADAFSPPPEPAATARQPVAGAPQP